MKTYMKYIKGLFLSAILAVSVSACREEVGLPDNGTPNNPEIATAGTYSGVWTRTSTTGEVITADGTMTLAADEQYVTVVTLSCPDIEEIDGMHSRANIASNALGYAFLNRLSTNDFATTFNGAVTKDNVASITFKKTVREGHKSTTYTYDFSGEKQ